MRIVIAGFGPFPGAPSNPSGRLAIALARRRRPALAGIEITSHVFATAYSAVDRDLPKLLARKPDVILIFGLARRRREVCVETRARNKRSILFPDVSGWRPNRAAIEAGQAPALTGNAPFPRLLNVLRQNAPPARLSRDAGAYLCNYAYWRALRHARDGRPLVQFVHIPWISATPRRASSLRGTPLSRLVAAGENLLIALIAAVRHLNPPPIAAHPSAGAARPQSHSSCALPAKRGVQSPRARWRQAAKSAR
jgi:pyroglutamyl-peptidase